MQLRESYNIDETAVFFIGIKTSMPKETPFWFERNRLIEICVRDALNQTTLYSVCDPGIVLDIPDISLKPNTISKDTIRHAGKATSMVLTELLEFLKQDDDKKVLLVAHDSYQVMDILCKEFLVELDMGFGDKSADFPWTIFDLVMFAKDRLDDLNDTYEEKFEPYSLKRMAEHFSCTSNLGSLGCADGDAVIIDEFFTNVVKPLLGEMLRDTSLLKWTIQKHRSCSLDRKIRTINGMTVKMTENLCDAVQAFFARDPSGLCSGSKHSEALFGVSDLILYASAKMQNMNNQDTGEKSLEIACALVEALLRCEGIFIQQDTLIVEILAAMCQTTPMCLIFHRSCGVRQAFPFIKNAIDICYLPLSIKIDDALILRKSLEVYTMTELITMYNRLDYEAKERFESNCVLEFCKPFNRTIMTKAFAMFSKAFYYRMKDFNDEQKS